jgi:hypothetical protein
MEAELSHPIRFTVCSLGFDGIEAFDDTGLPVIQAELAYTAHVNKLQELLLNAKLPPPDQELVQIAILSHTAWIAEMEALDGDGDSLVKAMVETLNNYKLNIELNLIWDSTEDFLWRQRGQLKLENSILEEFLPRLITPRTIPALAGVPFETGPRTTFAAAYFATTLGHPAVGGGLLVRTKDQDFAVGRSAYLQSSLSQGFPAEDTAHHKIFLAHAAAECKTNLDKTMFQSGVSDAHDLKIAFPGARFYLLCEWLDMTPISTLGTDIDEVIILRGKRLASNIRSGYSDSASRISNRDQYENFLRNNPIRADCIIRFMDHLRALFVDSDPNEIDVLTRGYF